MSIKNNFDQLQRVQILYPSLPYRSLLLQGHLDLQTPLDLQTHQDHQTLLGPQKVFMENMELARGIVHSKINDIHILQEMGVQRKASHYIICL